jgi:hypothetical protein
MLGVSPPGHIIWHPEMTTRIIQMYDSIYKTQSGASDISIEESIRQSFERMPRRWSFFKLDADKIKAASFLLLYMKNYAVMVFDAYRKAALKNDYSGLYLMQLYYDYFVPRAYSYGDFFNKAVSADYNPNIDYRKLFRPDSLEIGAPISLLLWGVSSDWPINMIAPEYRIPRLSNTETLMVGGNLDISTPVEFASKELLPYLPNGKQVILSDMGHVGDLVWSQYDAFTQMTVRYLDEGIVDTSKFKHDPVNFKTKKGFNKMAKRFYPIVFVLSLFK